MRNRDKQPKKRNLDGVSVQWFSAPCKHSKANLELLVHLLVTTQHVIATSLVLI